METSQSRTERSVKTISEYSNFLCFIERRRGVFIGMSNLHQISTMNLLKSIRVDVIFNK